MALTVALAKDVVSVNGTNTQSWSLATKPSSTNDTLLVLAYYVMGVAITAAVSDNNSGSWTQKEFLDDHTFNSDGGGMNYRKALTADITAGTYTDTTSASPVDLMDVTVLIQGGANAYDASAHAGAIMGASGSAVSWPTVTPSVGGAVFIAFVGVGIPSGYSQTTPTGYTLLTAGTVTADGSYVAVYYKVKAAGDTTAETPSTTPTYTGGTPSTYFGLIAFKPTSTAVPINVSDRIVTYSDPVSISQASQHLVADRIVNFLDSASVNKQKSIPATDRVVTFSDLVVSYVSPHFTIVAHPFGDVTLFVKTAHPFGDASSFVQTAHPFSDHS